MTPDNFPLKLLCFLASAMLLGVGSPVMAQRYRVPSLDEYYYTTRDSCPAQGLASDPLTLGNLLTSGEPLFREYSFLLDNVEYHDKFLPEPIDLAYAFYLVSRRIGNPEAEARIQWVSPYIQPENSEAVTSIIYRKFSAGYLQKCFSRSVEAEPSAHKDAWGNINSELYMRDTH